VSTLEIRRAKSNDAEAVAEVHVASWITSYSALLPSSYIAEFTYENRLACWTERLATQDPEIGIYVGLMDSRLIGFAAGGRERDGLTGADGELYSIYLLREAQGKGLGQRLTRQVAIDLAALGMRSMSVWVLAKNPARHFYQSLGARPVCSRKSNLGGEVFVEVGYRWDDIRMLLD
jgi:GNAT superfamily N-acetyltransferase